MNTICTEYLFTLITLYCDMLPYKKPIATSIVIFMLLHMIVSTHFTISIADDIVPTNEVISTIFPTENTVFLQDETSTIPVDSTPDQTIIDTSNLSAQSQDNSTQEENTVNNDSDQIQLSNTTIQESSFPSENTT